MPPRSKWNRVLEYSREEPKRTFTSARYSRPRYRRISVKETARVHCISLSVHPTLPQFDSTGERQWASIETRYRLIVRLVDALTHSRKEWSTPFFPVWTRWLPSFRRNANETGSSSRIEGGGRVVSPPADHQPAARSNNNPGIPTLRAFFSSRQ